MKRVFGAVLSLCVLSIFGYVAYTILARVPDFRNVNSQAALQAYPSAVCNFSTGGFREAMKGTMYVYHGAIRSNYQYASSGGSVLIHDIITSDGTSYGWKDGALDGYQHKVDYSTNADSSANSNSSGSFPIADLRTVESMECTRWWFPDASIFVVPDAISFTPLNR